ncbi:MAG TPA: DUF1697 domain-containing protein [Aequorivita sp.]|nr:DUF1697 domain-containing protein [Aequorivita sp.]
MQTYIALLRGINVGGHKKLKMEDLKLLCEDLGFEDVVTYIQSGNVVFSAKEEKDISDKIAKEIEKRFGWEVPVLVKTADAIEKILKDCPFEEAKKAEAYFMLLATPPKKELMEAVSEISYPNEEFMLTPDCVYIHFGNGYGNAKLNNNFFEKKLEVAATTRNYRTLAKLVEMAG